MKINGKKFLLCAMSLFISLVSYGQDAISDFDSFFNTLQCENRINGNILVKGNNKVIYKRSFGFADILTRQPNNENTRFVMASVSKPFTATAVLQLAEKDMFALDDKLSKYLPDFPFEDITIRHLLSHTSGLPNTEELFGLLLEEYPDRRFDNNDVLPALNQYGKGLRFTPGDKYEYGNVNYNLLAILVEKVSGEPFADYMKDHVFRPAGMNSTGVVTGRDTSLSGANAQRYIQPANYIDEYILADSVQALRKFTYNFSGFTGQGNVVSTIPDMEAFDRALYDGSLLTDSSIRKMFTPIRLNNGTIPYFRAGIDEASYGLGWYIFRNEDDGKVVWHSGGIPGMNTFMIRNIDRKQFIMVTDNAQNPSIGPEVYLILNKKPFERKKSLARLYVKALYKEGIDHAAFLLGYFRSDDSYYLSEGEMNAFGLEFMRDGLGDLALEALKVNTVLFPESFNVYDSYGEVLLKSGYRREAEIMYRRSVELNPSNDAGEEVLKSLSAQ